MVFVRSLQKCWMSTNMDSDRKITGKGKSSTRIKTNIIACFTSTNKVQTSLALNSDLRGDEPLSNGLTCATEKEVTALGQTCVRVCVCVFVCMYVCVFLLYVFYKTQMLHQKQLE
jgi:hypothetical protein